MPKQTLAQKGNSSSLYMKSFVVAEGKVGKTTYLAAAALGALPHQKKGLVSAPENLHILAFDEACVDGLLKFLTESCKRPDVAAAVSIWDLTAETRKAGLSDGWNGDFLNALTRDLTAIKAEIAKGGVHAVIFASLTGMAGAIKAALAGKPDSSKKGSGMDQSKWDAMGNQLSFIRNFAQADTHHTFWEGHITKKGGGEDDEKKEETVGVQGSVGRNWGFNTESVVRLRREMMKYPNTTIDKVYMDTRPTLDFVSGGRGFNDSLAAKEYDLVEMAEKLGKKVGGYVKAEAAAQPAAPR